MNIPRDQKLRKTYLHRKAYVASEHHDLTRARRHNSMTLNFCNQLHWYLQPGSLVGTLGRAWAWRVSHRCLQSTCRRNWRRWCGVDGIIDQDRLGLDRIYVQAKRYAEGNTVGSGAIRDFFGRLNCFKATKGLFVTASTFSPSARQTADQLSRRIVLIDGEQLTRLMIRHGVGCRIEETLYLKKVGEEFFE